MTFSKISLGVAAASMLALAACQAPIQGQTNDNTRQGAMVGAGLGAVVGALTGDDSNDRWRNAAIGAAVGGGLGAVGGQALDRQEAELARARQEAELRQQLGGNVGIVNNGQNLTVTMPQDVLFGTNSTAVSIQSQTDLRTVAASLNRYPNTSISVIGHTDSTGSASYNQDLSVRRAQAVASVLINGGVAPARVYTVGRGASQPIASNATPDGRQLNRRVEIIITPTN
ncbi:OmpA family protein [Ketogulonicigenium vulgare Y25]|uniref:OmpA family protein n=1 Tax=Ketogulonicigenium vulgare TaxID=92945 RepID=UPI0001E6564A|nr:OmpA family protein [Ketogulonicigenium vulgare]ADO41289.1 OmpA family protein [Ketogulonicigenium vulgare Y25]